MQTPHILIVEDELVTRNTLKSIFEAEGYDVFEATDGAEMHQILSENDINLVIMDINLPGKNGLLLARELREQANVALMFLTGRDNEVDKILGLEIGADDYITKPFNPRELTIRARNLLSRTMNLGTVSEERRSVESYKFNGWELDINSRSLIGPDGEQYKLPRSEFRAMLHFCENPNLRRIRRKSSPPFTVKVIASVVIWKINRLYHRQKKRRFLAPFLFFNLISRYVIHRPL